MSKRPALERIHKKDPRFAKRLAFAFDFPDVVLSQPMPPARPIPARTYNNWLAPGYLQRGYGGTREWPFDFGMAVRRGLEVSRLGDDTLVLFKASSESDPLWEVVFSDSLKRSSTSNISLNLEQVVSLSLGLWLSIPPGSFKPSVVGNISPFVKIRFYAITNCLSLISAPWFKMSRF